MANPLTNPDRFFAELSGRDPNLLAPFLIVLITATISAVSTAMIPYSSGAAAAAGSYGVRIGNDLGCGDLSVHFQLSLYGDRQHAT